MAQMSGLRFKWCVVAAVVAAGLIASVSTPLAQPKIAVHLNPVVDKLAQGKHVFGVSTDDLSTVNAEALIRDPDLDYVYINMEHTPMDFTALLHFLYGMVDKAAILKKGNPQPNVAVFARFAPFGREQNQWVVKQALDIGLMGILFNNIETKEEATLAVQAMRYMPRRGTPANLMEPRGLRGAGASTAAWFWGVDGEEYRQHADVWPLNPQGDMLAWMMIETVEGVKNAADICSVPGVGGIYLGSGGDLSTSMGVAGGNHPEVDAAMKEVTKTCLAKKVPVGGTVNTKTVAGRIKEGWTILNFGGANGGLTTGNDEVRKAARTAGAKR